MTRREAHLMWTRLLAMRSVTRRINKLECRSETGARVTDQLDLFVVLVVIYATECVAWMRRSGLALVRGARRWHVTSPNAALGNGEAGLAFGSLLPTSTLFVVHHPDLAWSIDGIVAHDSLPLDPAHRAPLPGPRVPYAEAATARLDGARLQLGNLWIAGSPGLARRIKHDLDTLAALDDNARAAALDARMAAAFDTDEITRRLERFYRVSGWLDYLTTALFALSFLAAPIAVVQRGLSATWRPLFALFVALWLINVIAFFVAHRRLYPKAPGDRWTRTLSLTFVPLSAMRSRDHLARPLLDGCDPLVAAVALAGTSAHPIAHRVLRDLHAPVMDEAPEVAATRREHRARLLAHLEPTLTRLGVDCAAALAPPSRDTDAVGYCPRCQQQYLSLDTTCDDCRETPLTAFDVG